MMTTPAPMSFSGHIDDARAAIDAAGFSPELWVPEHGWDPSIEEEAAKDPFLPQLLAAFQCFLAYFMSGKIWVHLGAPMQAGKTGVVTALIRLIIKNMPKINIRPTRIFILTGMNDNAWRKQTRERLPSSIRENVFHNGGLTAFRRALIKLAGGEHLRNVLIVLDESHIASSVKNRPQKFIYDTVAHLCPEEKWLENNVRFLTISATDPAKVLVMRGDETARVVRLQTAEDYQSIESLHAEGRIRWLETFGDLHEKKGMTELHRCITEEFADQPCYHIIRPRAGKAEAVAESLVKVFPDCIVHRYDSEEKAMGGAGAATDVSSCSSDVEDINTFLCTPPDKHTFIILKNMFYAAKTLDDSHVGVLWDRLGGKDDTNLQSLLGRACGYGKSDRTIVYASRSTTENYLRFWRELCSNPRMDPVIAGIPASKISGKMAGVVAKKISGGAHLVASKGISTPVTVAAVGGAGAPSAAPVREVANEANFAHIYMEYSTLTAARFPHMRTPKQDADGFYLTSTTKNAEKQSYAAIKAICTGKKTANLPWRDLEVGKSVKRLYVGYRDMLNPASAVFFVRTLTRLA